MVRRSARTPTTSARRFEEAREATALPQLRHPQVQRAQTGIESALSIPVPPGGPLAAAFMPTGADVDAPAFTVEQDVNASITIAGYGAKTDRVDAAMLARMGMALDLDATPVRSDAMHEIRELHIARFGLIKDRTACRNRLQAARNKVVLAQLRARPRQVENQIEQIDAELARLVAEDPALAHRYGILLSIPGIGPVAAIAMLVEMPELGTMDGKEAASLAGLAPITRESGRWKGQSRIGGGRRGLRLALYMPALVATRHNRQLGQTYQALCSAGNRRKSRSPL